jgi:hypothetical protein
MGLLGVARANTSVGVSPVTFLLLLLQIVPLCIYHVSRNDFHVGQALVTHPWATLRGISLPVTNSLSLVAAESQDYVAPMGVLWPALCGAFMV